MFLRCPFKEVMAGYLYSTHRRTRRRGGNPPGLKISGQVQSCSKTLNDNRYTFNTVNSGHTLFFRASASCLKILNDNKYRPIFNNSKFRAHSVFQGKRKLLKNPECKKYIQYCKKFQGKLCFSGKVQGAQKS